MKPTSDSCLMNQLRALDPEYLVHQVPDVMKELAFGVHDYGFTHPTNFAREKCRCLKKMVLDC